MVIGIKSPEVYDLLAVGVDDFKILALLELESNSLARGKNSHPEEVRQIREEGIQSL